MTNYVRSKLAVMACAEKRSSHTRRQAARSSESIRAVFARLG
jgi:hypothetical protein